MVENIQNVSLFAISVSSLFSYIYYNSHLLWYGNAIGGGDIWFERLFPLVGIHATVDFFLTKNTDLRLHHACIFGILFYNSYYSVSAESRFPFLYPLLKTEISSLFYVLKYWLPPKSPFYGINSLLFYIAFYKFRIWDFYSGIIHNHTTLSTVFNRYSGSNAVMSAVLSASCYGLYILNLYWFLILNKILYKQIVKRIPNINTDKICHLLCSLLHWINIPVAILVYSSRPNEKHLFDVVGIMALSVSSYQYHAPIYKRLVTGELQEYNAPDKSNIVSFFNDALFINLRGFLVVVAHYYESPLFISVLCLSGVFHVMSVYYCVLNMFQKDIEEDDRLFSIQHNTIMAIPIAVDVFFIFMRSPTEIAVPFLLVNVVMGLLFVVEPFYRMNHMAFHLMLIAQNYYMCLSNSQ